MQTYTKEEGSNPLLLLDMDTVVFKSAIVTNVEKDIKNNIDRMIQDTLKETNTTDYLCAIKGPDNFRYNIYKNYKGNRPAIPHSVDVALSIGYEHLKKEHNAIPSIGMEADDLVSIWSYECRDTGRDYIISSIDKDLKQIPGVHFNFHKKVWDEVTPDRGHLSLMLQCLTGDNGDNIPGLQGIGPVKADKLLKGIDKPKRWTIVQQEWSKHHDAGNASMSYILLKLLTSWEEFDALAWKQTRT